MQFIAVVCGTLFAKGTKHMAQKQVGSVKVWTLSFCEEATFLVTKVKNATSERHLLSSEVLKLQTIGQLINYFRYQVGYSFIELGIPEWLYYTYFPRNTAPVVAFFLGDVS